MKIKSPRVVNQIRAALVFWQSMAATRGQHPSRTPDVARYFRTYSPMTIEEIDDVVEHIDYDEDEMMTIQDASVHFGIKTWTLRRRLKARGFRPALTTQSTHFYLRRHCAAAALDAENQEN